jgi:tRNA(Ile)-lysidine synthase
MKPTDSVDLAGNNGKALLDEAKIKFPLILRRWKPGDYFYPLGMRKKKKLARFFIDQKLSLTEKEKAWVIEMDKKIIWVVGMRIDDRFKVTPGTKKVMEISLDQNRLKK